MEGGARRNCGEDITAAGDDEIAEEMVGQGSTGALFFG